jgi:membrane protease YdiL (CAAX protease family)
LSQSTKPWALVDFCLIIHFSLSLQPVLIWISGSEHFYEQPKRICKSKYLFSISPIIVSGFFILTQYNLKRVIFINKRINNYIMNSSTLFLGKK